MSEYQYYEFRTVDRVLTDRELHQIRSLSTRAQITPTSFTNEYHFGDFRGDPRDMMRRYYDIHVYYANWGTVNWMLRVAKPAGDQPLWEQYVTDDTLNIIPAGDNLIVQFSTPPETEPDDMVEDPTGWAGTVIQLRNDLIAGDLRCLYLAWLLQLPLWDDPGDDMEPPLPPGLRQLSGPLKQFCEVFQLDPDLLAAAAQTSEPMSPTDEQGMRDWIARLPSAEKDQMLMELVESKRPTLAAELRARFSRSEASSIAQPSRRTIRQLIEAAESIREHRETAAARKAQQQRRRQETARQKHLQQIAQDPEPLWSQVESLISEKNRESYSRAAGLLADLRDAATLANQSPAFTQRFKQLRDRHRSKTALQSELYSQHLTL